MHTLYALTPSSTARSKSSRVLSVLARSTTVDTYSHGMCLKGTKRLCLSALIVESEVSLTFLVWHVSHKASVLIYLPWMMSKREQLVSPLAARVEQQEL